MDIKVITRHAPSNYGSLLQAIATQIILEHLGHTCKIIDYIRNDEQGLRGTMTALRGKREWNNNPLKKMVYLLLRYPEEKQAEMKFANMRKRYLKLTQRCSSHEDLKLLDADVFVTGSDQVWGPLLNGNFDSAYFLSFVDKKTKVAFASSFGKTDFTDTIVNEYKRYLSEYSIITVREDAAAEMLKQWGIPCVGQILDPTLILSEKDWERMVKQVKTPEQYVLVYQIHNDNRLGNYAQRLAKNIGLPLLRISPFLHQISREGKLKLLPGLGEFLYYIKQCSYFITDSFHGTAFALNFNKDFIEVLPNTSTSSRNLSILRLTKLENRIVSDFNDFSLINERINYEDVNSILYEQRKLSLEKIESILSALHT